MREIKTHMQSNTCKSRIQTRTLRHINSLSLSHTHTHAHTRTHTRAHTQKHTPTETRTRMAINIQLAATCLRSLQYYLPQ